MLEAFWRVVGVIDWAPQTDEPLPEWVDDGIVELIGGMPGLAYTRHLSGRAGDALAILTKDLELCRSLRVGLAGAEACTPPMRA